MEKTLRQLILMLAAGLCMALAASATDSAAAAPVAIDDLGGHSFLSPGEMKALAERYRHPLLRRYGEQARQVGGHGGMDFIMDSRLVYCLQNGLPLDMDVYDLAEWCCLAELGELSMDNGCAPVAVPDFTRGHWNDRQGYSHAYAAPADEQEAARKAADFTRRLTGK